MALRVCSSPGCPAIVGGRAPHCATHAAQSARNHPGTTRQQRGYGPEYQRARAELVGGACSMRLPGCTGTATTAQHTDDGRLVGACAHCNYADGGRRATVAAMRSRGGGVATAGGPRTRTARQPSPAAYESPASAEPRRAS